MLFDVYLISPKGGWLYCLLRQEQLNFIEDTSQTAQDGIIFYIQLTDENQNVVGEVEAKNVLVKVPLVVVYDETPTASGKYAR